jgi:formamidopyrimidine-DNA glycosylase
MPELPEVETVCRGVTPHITGRIVQQVIVRQPRLRWLVPSNLHDTLTGLTLHTVSRRAKYLLFTTDKGTLIIHLGMSGSLRIVNSQQDLKTHDHIDFVFADTIIMRYNDPRRFGAVLWTTDPITEHKLLKDLGPEPLLADFTGDYLHTKSKNRKVPVKSFIMDSHVVVGVGNIYANEALFMAGIHPLKHAGQITLAEYAKLAECIRTALANAIQQGGTTLRDFVNEAGKPGYFQQQLRVYGRAGLPCVHCQHPLQEVRLSNRSTVFCLSCQQ